MNAGRSTCACAGFPSAVEDHHVPPKVFSTVVNAAPRSPQPGLPRRQMPAIEGELIFRAIAATCCQVGRAGIVTPLDLSTSLRYMTNDDSA